MYTLPLPLLIGTRGGVEDKRHPEKVTTRRSVIINNIIYIRSLSYITICCEPCNWSTRREHYVSHYYLLLLLLLLLLFLLGIRKLLQLVNTLQVMVSH